MGINIGSGYGVSSGTWMSYKTALRHQCAIDAPTPATRHDSWPPYRSVGLWGDDLDEEAIIAVRRDVAEEPLWLLTEHLIGLDETVIPSEFAITLRERLAQLRWADERYGEDARHFHDITLALITAIDQSGVAGLRIS